MLEKLLTPEKVCEILGVRPRTLKLIVARGQITPTRVAKFNRFEPREVQEYIERQRVRKSAKQPARRKIPDLLSQPAALPACSRK